MLTRSLFTTIFLILFGFHSALGQSCLPSGIIFTTQGQVDSFSINYPGCTEIGGDHGDFAYAGHISCRNIHRPGWAY